MKKFLFSLHLLAFCTASIQAETPKQLTNLPTVYIETTDGEDIVSKEYYLKGTVTIVSENGTKIFKDSLDIKGRGNYSWNSTPKKPYRIKLYNKANLLDMPAKAKNWTLINNYGDKTLMRNLLAFDFSRRLEMPFSPSGRPVDVVLNGDYKGCYQLCDQMEVHTGRVEVEKLTDLDNAEPALSGGYMVEIDSYAYNEDLWFESLWKEGRRNDVYIPVTIKYPDSEDITDKQLSYIETHFNAMTTTIESNTVVGVTKYIDPATFVRHFLVGEFSGNTDTYWSTYMYKKRGSDKYCFGPVWDFDIAYENDGRTYPINDNSEWIFASTGSTANGARAMMSAIISVASIDDELKMVWSKYRNSGAITKDKLWKVVDDYATELNESQKLNFEVWDIMDIKVHENPMIWGSYEAEVQNVKDYIANRIDWMDYKLDFHSALNTVNASKIQHWIQAHELSIKGLSENAKVEIMDLTGRLVKKAICSESYQTNLDRGVYVVRVTDSLSGNKTFKCLIP